MIHYERGIYQCKVIEQGWQVASTGKDMLVFKVRPDYLIGKDEAGNETFEDVYADPQYPERTLRIVIDGNNEKMMDFAIKKLRACGFEGTSFTELDLVGSDIRAVCDEGEYNGKPNEQWDFYLPYQAADVRPIDSSQARKLDALFGKRLKEGATTKPASQPQQRPAAQQSQSPAPQERETVPSDVPPYEDDVPF